MHHRCYDCLSDALCLDLQGKVVAAVCHGPAALTEAKLNGEYLVKGKKVGSANQNGLSLGSCAKGVSLYHSARKIAWIPS